ncbi:MAG: 2-oxoacid:acceptor oxidoreductase family protein, partial [Pseudomonadota bacterium]
MEEKSASRRDVMIAGLGGMGVLMIGHILSSAALREFKHVSWLPSYSTEKRGGLCECTVIFSNEDIASPIIDRAQAVMVLDAGQLKAFESRVCPGGVILVETSGLQGDREGTDYRLFRIPGMETAVSLGAIQMSNLIMLGAYVVITGAIPQQL